MGEGNKSLLVPVLKHARVPMEKGRTKWLGPLASMEARGAMRAAVHGKVGTARFDRTRKEDRTSEAAIVTMIIGRVNFSVVLCDAARKKNSRQEVCTSQAGSQR
jgi:hypothetical protein